MKINQTCLQCAKGFAQKMQVKKRTSIPPLPTVSELVKLYRLRTSVRLAQNFLYDPAIVNRFVSCAKPKLDGYYICEVGPGPGSITRAILRKGAEKVTVVEKDKRFLPILQYVADVAEERMNIVHGDALKFDCSMSFPNHLAQPWDGDSPPFFFIGNLPFNVSLPLLFQWLDLISRQDGVFKLGRIPLVLTFQKEVGERLCAPPLGKQRCRLSVTTQYLCDVDPRFLISGRSFIPPPKVDVAAMKLTPKRKFLIELPFKEVDHVVKHVMHFRQKPCHMGVASLFPPKRDDLVKEMFEVSGVNSKDKPIALDNLHYRDLAYAFDDIAKRIPQLRLVDTYEKKKWRTYFDENGEPLSEETEKRSTTVTDDISIS